MDGIRAVERQPKEESAERVPHRAEGIASVVDRLQPIGQSTDDRLHAACAREIVEALDVMSHAPQAPAEGQEREPGATKTVDEKDGHAEA